MLRNLPSIQRYDIFPARFLNVKLERTFPFEYFTKNVDESVRVLFLLKRKKGKGKRKKEKGNEKRRKKQKKRERRN